MWLFESNREKHLLFGFLAFISMFLIFKFILGLSIFNSLMTAFCGDVFGSVCLEVKDYLYSGRNRNAIDLLDFLSTILGGVLMIFLYTVHFLL